MQRFIAPSARPNAIAVRRPGIAADPRPPDRDEDHRGEAEPPEGSTRRPELVEQLDGERRADLERRDREDDEGDAPVQSALAVPQLAQGRAVPHALLRLAVGAPARRLVEPARALVALLGPQRRLGAAALAQRRLARRQQRAARAAPPRARVGVEQRDLAARRHDEADHLASLLRDDLAARERRRAHARQCLLAGEAPCRAARGDEELAHGGVVGRLSRAHARAGRARAWPLPRAGAPR